MWTLTELTEEEQIFAYLLYHLWGLPTLLLLLLGIEALAFSS
jgi:hypothetical protein